MNKTIICYFSATGTTKVVAEKLANLLNGNLFEIEPVIKYTNEDLNWMDEKSRTTLEKNDESIRPEIKNNLAAINEYNNVIIGFPVWWYKEPNIIDTFIEENNLDDKNVYVYVTSGGSTFAGSLKHLKDKYPNINFISGKTLNENISENEILEWIKL